MKLLLCLLASYGLIFIWGFVQAWRGDRRKQYVDAMDFVRRAEGALQETEYAPFAITSVRVKPGIRGGHVWAEWRNKNGCKATADRRLA